MIPLLDVLHAAAEARPRIEVLTSTSCTSRMIDSTRGDQRVAPSFMYELRFLRHRRHMALPPNNGRRTILILHAFRALHCSLDRAAIAPALADINSSTVCQIACDLPQVMTREVPIFPQHLAQPRLSAFVRRTYDQSDGAQRSFSSRR